MPSDVRELLQAIRDQYRLSWEGLHGVGHWGRVCENGRRIAEPVGADPEVLFYFAVFHDACRVSDRRDPRHGPRGADLAARLRGRCFELDDERFELLIRACTHHTGGRDDLSPTVCACWDSDRLDLARARIRPDPRLLCTVAARDPELIEWASSRSVSWTVPGFVRTDWATVVPAGGPRVRG
jgi:uncharacterized protein